MFYLNAKIWIITGVQQHTSTYFNERFVTKWRQNVTQIWVNSGSGNSLLPGAPFINIAEP